MLLAVEGGPGGALVVVVAGPGGVPSLIERILRRRRKVFLKVDMIID